MPEKETKGYVQHELELSPPNSRTKLHQELTELARWSNQLGIDGWAVRALDYRVDPYSKSTKVTALCDLAGRKIEESNHGEKSESEG